MCDAARPVVHGLRDKYASDVDFVEVDFLTPDGQTKMREFKMKAHGYAIQDRWGNLTWTSLGHSFTPELLEQKIQEALAAPPPA